jgi:hypothetical protein
MYIKTPRVVYQHGENSEFRVKEDIKSYSLQLDASKGLEVQAFNGE